MWLARSRQRLLSAAGGGVSCTGLRIRWENDATFSAGEHADVAITSSPLNDGNFFRLYTS